MCIIHECAQFCKPFSRVSADRFPAVAVIKSAVATPCRSSVDQAKSLADIPSGRLCIALGIPNPFPRRVAFSIQRVGHRIGGMRTDAQAASDDPAARGWHTPRRSAPYTQTRAENLRVDLLDGIDLLLQLPVVSAFVRRLDMDVDKIRAAREHVDCRSSFSGEVRLVSPRRTLDLDYLHPGAAPDALNQIHRGDYRAVQPRLLKKRRERGLSSLAPKPDGVGGIFTRVPPRPIDGMIRKQTICLVHPAQAALRRSCPKEAFRQRAFP